jgi:hypothetical protein
MDAPLPQLAIQFVSEPLISQRIEGTVRLRFWGQSVDPSRPATWALAIRLVSRDGKGERGDLLPLTTGKDNDAFGPELEPRNLGPFTLAPLDACDGDRIRLELGTCGEARIEFPDEEEACLKFSGDIHFEDLQTALRDDRASRNIGKCIYCGRTDEPLSREHIIPRGLNGELTLTDASCGRCRDITSRLEDDLLRNAFGPARVGLRLRTQRPEERPKHLPIQVRRGGNEILIDVPVDEYPAIVALPVFAPPAHASGRSYSSGVQLVNVSLARVWGPPLAEVHRKYGHEYTGIQLSYNPVAFARAIAKIAYGFTVLKLGLERIADRYVLPAMLGEASDIGRWVGCDPGPPISPSTDLHAWSFGLDQDHKEIHVLVRLFALFGAPEYHIVVGRFR